MQGNYTQAIDDFTKAIALNSNYADAYRNRGMAYNLLGKKQQVDADLAKAEKLSRR